MIAPEDYQAVVAVASRLATQHGLHVSVRHVELDEVPAADSVIVEFKKPHWRTSRAFPDLCLQDTTHFQRWLEHELEPCALEVLAHV